MSIRVFSRPAVPADPPRKVRAWAHKRAREPTAAKQSKGAGAYISLHGIEVLLGLLGRIVLDDARKEALQLVANRSLGAPARREQRHRDARAATLGLTETVSPQLRPLHCTSQ
jgi:hypothetical protein